MKQIEVVAAIIRDEEGRLFSTQRGYGERSSGTGTLIQSEAVTGKTEIKG